MNRRNIAFVLECNYNNEFTLCKLRLNREVVFMILKKIVFAEGFAEIPTDRNDIRKAALINPTLSFALPYIPATFSFCIFVMLQGVSDKTERLNLKIINNSNDKTIFESDNMLEPNFDTPLAMGIPSEIIGSNFGITIQNAVIETQGEYECIVTLGEGETLSEKLHFVKRK